MTLVDLDRLRYYVGVSGTTVHDTFLTILNEEVSRRVELFTERHFLQTNYAEYYDVPTDAAANTGVIFLKHYPVIELASVTDDAKVGAIAVDTADDDFHLYAEDGFIKYDGGFTPGNQTVLVTYAAGYTGTDIPADIQGVVGREVKRSFNESGGVTSEDVAAEKIGDYSYRKFASQGIVMGLMDSSVAVLNRYQKWHARAG